MRTSNAICNSETNMNLYFQVWLMCKTYYWHCGFSYWNWINIFVGLLSLTFYTLCQCKPQINNINKSILVNKNYWPRVKGWIWGCLNEVKEKVDCKNCWKSFHPCNCNPKCKWFAQNRISILAICMFSFYLCVSTKFDV